MVHRFILCIGAFLTLATPVMAKSAEEITARWQKQFKQLKSLSYTANVNLTISDKTLKSSVLDKVSFVKDGPKYRIQIETASIGKVKLPSLSSVLGSAYDGQYYEEMSKSGDTTFLRKTKKPAVGAGSYQIANPFLPQYSFVFSEHEAVNFAPLQGEAIWKRLLKRIRKVTPTIRNGRKGSELLIDAPKDKKGSKRYYKVFVDDITGVPLYVIVVGEKSSSKVGNELIVADFKQFGKQERNFTFPLKVIATQRYEGKEETFIVFNAIAETLKVNQPVVQKFSFPQTPDTIMEDD